MSKEQKKAQFGVYVVDDSAFMRNALSEMINSDPALWVVGSARTGDEALQRIAGLDPDVITLDVEMPGLDGLQTLKRIMAEFPRPVIMVSSLTLKNAETTFAALEVGAFDYVPKQLSPSSLDILHLRDDLVAKIKAGAVSRLRRAPPVTSRKPPQPAEIPKYAGIFSEHSIVAIGVSTGGPKALQDILPALPADLMVPILVVQHMPAGFTAPFAKRLNNLCAISIREAANGVHLTLDHATARTLICLSDKPENQLHTPSIDIMMQSVASTFGSRSIGIIMTGMGADGAQGMSSIHAHGGLTVGQDEASCTVYGMPRVCAEMGILNRVVSLSQIPDVILQATRYRKITAS